MRKPSAPFREVYGGEYAGGVLRSRRGFTGDVLRSKIAGSESFEKHLNKYNVFRVNMTEFSKKSETMQGSIDYLCRRLQHELKREFADIDCFDWNDLISVLNDVWASPIWCSCRERT